MSFEILLISSPLIPIFVYQQLMQRSNNLFLLVLIFSPMVTFGQPALPAGAIMEFEASNVEEELAIFYPVDLEVVRQHFSYEDIRPAIVPNQDLPESLDTTKTYVLAALLIVSCNDCSLAGHKTPYILKNWLFTDGSTEALKGKGLGNYIAIETGSWVTVDAVATAARLLNLNFQKATVERSEHGNSIGYVITSQDFQLEMKFDRDTVTYDTGNDGLYQTVWDADRKHFTVYASKGHQMSKVRSFNLEISGNDPILRSAMNTTSQAIEKGWTAIGGTYKN